MVSMTSLLNAVEAFLETAHDTAASTIEQNEELNEEERQTLVLDLRKTGHQDFGDFLARRWMFPEE
jgi:HD-like signal output (HDOD) protein